MYHAAITNKGHAWLEAPGETVLDRVLAAIAKPYLTASDPQAMFAAFEVRVRERLGEPTDPATLRTLWRQLAEEALIKVREPLPPGTPVDVVLMDPPVEQYRITRLGGKRPSVGTKPREMRDRPRIRRSVTLGPDAHEAVLAAQTPNETYSETVERLIKTAAQVVAGHS